MLGLKVKVEGAQVFNEHLIEMADTVTRHSDR